MTTSPSLLFTIKYCLMANYYKYHSKKMLLSYIFKIWTGISHKLIVIWMDVLYFQFSAPNMSNLHFQCLDVWTFKYISETSHWRRGKVTSLKHKIWIHGLLIALVGLQTWESLAIMGQVNSHRRRWYFSLRYRRRVQKSCYSEGIKTWNLLSLCSLIFHLMNNIYYRKYIILFKSLG